MIDERRIGSCTEFAHDIMSAKESECACTIMRNDEIIE